MNVLFFLQVIISLLLLFDVVQAPPPTYTAASIGIPAVGISRDELVRHYYTIGYTAKQLMCLLLSCHNITLSLRQIRRILSRLHIRRMDRQHNVNDIIDALRRELECSGQNLGYRAMWRRLKTKYDIHITQKLVRQSLSILDPDGVDARSARRLRRRRYFSKGPNYLVHLDGYDKLKQFGFAVHGAIDGFSRKVLWLHVGFTNNDPRYIAQFFVEYVQRINGAPCVIRGDRGTENSLVRDIQLALRLNHNDTMRHVSFMYGSSTSNQRIERWWRHLTENSTSYWKELFKYLQDTGVFDNTNLIHIEALRFCFTRLIQRDFDLVLQEWNQHSIRVQNIDGLPFGKPDMMYYVPEMYNCEEQKMPLLYTQQDIDGVKRSFCKEYPPFGCRPELIDAVNVLVGNVNNFDLPESVEEALTLFESLIELLE